MRRQMRRPGRQFNRIILMFPALMVLGLIIGTFSIPLYGQTGQITGPPEIDKCDIETYTITVTNDSAQSLCSIVVTNTLPNADFSYVNNSGVVCLPGDCSSCNLNPANPSESGNDLIWDIDTLCGVTQLGPGESFTIEFQMETNCDAISGTNVVRVDYEECANPGTPLWEQTSTSIQVNPGAITITKTDEVVPAGLDDVVTWTLTITNTGLGATKNVAVADTMGNGLQYVSSTPAGQVAGQVVTWTSAEVAGFAEMAKNDVITIDVQVRVIACDELDNTADVSWGCDGGPTCFDTAVDGGTATAAVEFQPTNPYLVLTPPVINLDYCESASTVVLSLFNDNAQATGDARNTIVKLQNLGPLTITNVQGGVTFNNGVSPPQFENIPDIVPGDTYNITFDVGFSDPCTGASGTIVYIPEYLDECDNVFYPTPVLGSYTLGTAATSLTVDKTGPTTAYIESQVNYTIDVTYAGPTTCGTPAGNTGTVTVTDTIPPGFTIVDPDGGTIGGGGLGTIQWTFDPASDPNFTAVIILQLPDRTQCEAYCNTTTTNSVTASVTDCCGCTLSGSASVTTAIECDQDLILTSFKGVSPATIGPCETTTITNTYDFADTALLDNVDLAEMVLTENNNNTMSYVPGSAVVYFGAAPVPPAIVCFNVTDNTPAGSLQITFGGCPTPDSVRAQRLVIEYQMEVTDQSQPQPPCDTAYTFYSWSDLNLGPDHPTGQCLGDPTVHETVPITVQPPSMGVSVGTLPNFVENCGAYNVTITVNQLTAGVEPYDVRLVLENVNYYVINITGEGGVTPTDYLNPTPITYNGEAAVQWDYFDAFAVGGDTGTITLQVQKRCSDSPDLVAHLFYDDLCNDDNAGNTGDYDDMCSTSATDASLLLLDGDIFIEKTPEVVFTDSNQVQWTIYVTNAGDGVATNVTLEDTLDAAHVYTSSIVSPNTGVTTTPGTPANGVTWTITSMDPGEVRTITLLTDFTACSPLGNTLSARWGCDYTGSGTIEEQCEAVGPIRSEVQIPTPNLVSTSLTVSPQDMCATQQADITLRNAGQTNVYELVVAQDLPEGLTYAGNPQYQYDGGGWGAAPAPVITNPTPTTTRLTWSYADDDGNLFYDYLLELPKGDVLEISFDMTSDCDFAGGNLQVETNYKNPCGDVVNPTSVGTFVLGVRLPEVTVTKTRTDPAGTGAVPCGAEVEWEITVENTGDVTDPIPVIWVEDLLDPGFSFVSATGDATYMSDNGYSVDPQLTTFEIIDLPRGATATLTVRAQSVASGQPNCSDLANSVTAFWGCGSADGNSSTKPGVDGGDAVYCLSGTGVQDSATESHVPDLDVSHSLTPNNIAACGGSTTFTLTVTNNSTLATVYNLDAVLTLPDGLEYVPGTSVVTCPATGGAGDPGGGTGPTLTYYNTGNPNNPNNLCDTLGPGQTITLDFDLTASCYTDDNIVLDLYYYDCCDTTQHHDTSNHAVVSDEPVLQITKVLNTPQVDCTAQANWTITVTNIGSGDADVVRIEDTLGDWWDVDLGASTAGLTAMPLISAQTYGWEILNLARSGQPGDSATFTLAATLNPDGGPQADCTEAPRDNSVRAIWACGAGDGDPTTIGEYTCSHDTWVSTTSGHTVIPDLDITNISANIDCTVAGDGAFAGTVSVTVENVGDGDTLSGFTVSVTDGTWTGTGTTGVLAAGDSVVVSIDTSGWNPDCNGCAAYTLDATVDSVPDVCECNETNNTGTLNYTAPIADLVVNSITPTCTADGRSRVRVNIGNTGCANISSSFTVHLEDDQGNSNDITVNSLNAGSNTNVDFNNWPTACAPASINFTATADYNDDICECDAVHSLGLAYNNTSPNLVVSTVTPSTGCAADGTVSGTIQVQVTNSGNGAAAGDFRISVNDGQGWSSELWYNANLGGTLPLGAGASDTVTFNWTRGFTSTPYVCSFPTISVTVDSQGDICECTNASNTNTDSYNMTYPNLRVLSITPSCTADGSYSIDVDVDNNGCGNAAGVTVQLSDNDGQSQSQVIALNAGASQTLTFAPWPADGNPASLTFTAVIDPGTTICELSGADNSDNATYDRPNLNLFSVTPSCTADDTFQVEVVIQNNGSSTINNNFVVRLTDNDGNTLDQNFTAVGGTLPLNNGTQQTVTFNNWPFDCNPTTVNFTGELDPTNQICESTDSDNTNNTGTLTVYDLQAVSVTANAVCTADGTITGTMAVVVSNSGGNAINSDFRIQVNDGQGWTSELWYNTDLGGALPLGAGADDTVTFNWTRAFTATPYVCGFPAIGVTVDSQGDICECTNANNTTSGSYTLPFSNLRVTSVTPTCTDDGNYSVEVVVDNNGCANAAGIVVQLSDDDGQTQSRVIALNAGASQTLTFAPWPSDGNPVSLTFIAEIDPGSAICELSGADNSVNTTFDRANLNLVSITPSCVSDDTFQVSLVIENNGSSVINTDFVVRLTDNDGNTPAQNFTALGGTLPLNNGTQQTVTFNNWPTDGNPTTINFNGELDPTDQVCESNNGDNTNTGTITVYGLRAVSVTASEVCVADGTITGTMDVTVSNNGGNVINTDFQILVDDGRGWTSELFFQADLGGTLPMAVNASETVTFNWTRAFTASPYTCSFPAITVTVDSQGAICESESSDNQATTSHTLNLVDLIIDTVASSITCISDGSLTGTTVTVTNTGCAAAAGVVVRLASDCGLTFADETVNLAAGETADVFFPFTSGITTCTCGFSAEIDPDDAVCEIDGTNNSGTSSQTMIIPDVEIQGETLSINCVDDGQIEVSGTVTLVNNGCGPNLTENIPMRFTLYDAAGCRGNRVVQWTQVFRGVNLPSGGGTQRFTVQPFEMVTDFCSAAVSGGCRFSIFVEADYSDVLCEWDGTDNTYCADINAECLDLEAAAVTAATNVTNDGIFNGTITVTVTNSGGSPITEDFSIRVDDGNGWSSELRYNADLGGTLPLAAGVSVEVTFTWNRDFTAEPFTCEFDPITVQLDSQDQICQCRTENDTVTTTYFLPLANLVPTAITPTCGSDGTYRVEVTVENNGCTGAAAGSFTVHLEDSLGHTADFQVNSLASGNTTTVTFDDWPAACDPDTVTFTVRVDYNNQVYEITDTDNLLNYTYTNTSPDLVITDVTPSAGCSSPGNIDGAMTVTLVNNGNGPVTEDFKIIIDDGRGWNNEKYFQADLNGTLPMGTGESATVTVDWDRSFTGETLTCDFNNIAVSLDTLTNVCECTRGNNETTASYHLPYPDLHVQSILPICSADGERYVEMVIGNKGCEPQNDDFSITITDSTGESQRVTFRSLGGKLPLGVGETQKVTISQWTFDCSSSSTEYRITLDPENKICDLELSDNTLRWTHTPDEPDLSIGDIDWDCRDDGSIFFTVTVTNNGLGSAANVPCRVYDESGNVVFSQTVNLAKGTSTLLSFTTGVYPKDQDLSFRFVVDEELSVCECDGTNNEKSTIVNCPPDVVVEEGKPVLELAKFCPPGQAPGGLFRFELQLENSGDADAENVTIEDTLPDGFQYVSGSSALDGMPQGDPRMGPPLVWEIGTLEKGRQITLIFSAVADADIDPGRYMNNALARGVTVVGGKIVSNDARCATVVSRQAGAGCCLKVDQWPMDGGPRPEGPLSFIEPYFHTESAMFTAYAIFNLWRDAQLETGSMPLFMKERLHNYARSTIEEFYFNSRLGLTLPDGTLWLALAGAYPEQELTENPGLHWTRKQVDETVTVSQMGFELLALNEAVNIETREEIKQKLKRIIDKKMEFLGRFMENPDKFPHGWEVEEKKKDEVDKIKRLDADASLYDKTVLYLSMVELGQSGNEEAAAFAPKLRETLQHLDKQTFDPNNLREEFFFILSLLETEETNQAAAKVKDFEFYWKKNEGRETEKDEGRKRTRDEGRSLQNLYDYALAAGVDRKAGGTVYADIMKRMEAQYYLKDAGIFADKQPDFTFKMNLKSLASLLLAFNTTDKTEQEHSATVLYRTFDEVGLFLKKRNLMVGKPLYSILKNYPFAEPMLPVLSFTKAKESIAPVFSENAVVHSTRVKPLGEVLIPGTFSKILSPSYETRSSRIAAVSFGLQYFGKLLTGHDEWVVKEEGRSLNEAGKAYVDSLMLGGAGIRLEGNVLLPYDDLAVRGPKQGEHNLEPLNSGMVFSMGTLADYMTAEKFYVDGGGKHVPAVLDLLAAQARIVEKFKEMDVVPAKFSIFIAESGEITVIPKAEPASKITIAKLYHLLPKDDEHRFLERQLKKAKGELAAEDLIFLSAAPELVPYFKKEIKAIVNYKDSKISYNAADIIGRRLLGLSGGERSLENLLENWDKEAVLPKSDNIENIEDGLIYHHEPGQFLLYLLATHDSNGFRFKRTLNFFTYMLENEWGLEWNSFIKLPSAEYRVFREEPRTRFEPGDLVNFRVRVDNTCPEGFGSAFSLPSLYLKARFMPSLIYMGTQMVDGLDVLSDFQWRYRAFPEGSLLEYIYQAFVPYDFQGGFIDGWIYAGGRQGVEDFGPDSGSGDDCEDLRHIRRVNFVPFDEVRGLVFEDGNVNGIKDLGELGIPNIMIKDTRGRVLRSDAEGRFTVLAGDKHEGIQIELRSVPGSYVLYGPPTRLVNRNYTGEVYFALIPTKTVTGFVYEDANGNGTFDESEVRPAGVQLKAKDKEVITGKDGEFIFRNLPDLWQQWIEISKDQSFYKGNKDSLKFSF